MIKFILASMLAFTLIGCKNYRVELDETKITLTAAEEAYIASHPEIRWGVEDNRPPFIFVQNGQVMGLSYEYLQLIAKKTGLKLKPVRTVTFLGSINSLESDEIDIILAIRPTIELSQAMQFTLPFVSQRGVFVFRKNTGQPRSPFIAAVRVGYANPTKRYLESRFPDMKLIETEDDEQSLVLLQKGLVDGSMMDEATADYWIKREVLDLQKAPISFDYPYAFGFRGSDPLLGSILTKGLEAIRAKDRKTLDSKWLSD